MFLFTYTAPVLSDIGQPISQTLQQNQISYFKTSLPELGMTIRLDVNEGSVVLFGSNKIQTPNEAFYDFMLSTNKQDIFVTEDTFGNTPSKTKRQITKFANITVYISIQGQSVSNSFIFNTTVGDTTVNTGIIHVHTCTLTVLLFQTS